MFTINEDVTAYSNEEIATLIEQGNAELDRLFSIENPSVADVDEAQQVTASVEALASERDSRAEAATRMSAMREARTQFAAEPEEEATEVVEPEAQVEASDESDEGDEDETVIPAETEVVEANTEKEQAVTASATPKSTARKALSKGGRQAPPENKTAALTITAAADVPGFATGSVLDDLDAVGKAYESRVRAFPGPAGIEGGQMTRYGVASFRIEGDPNLVASGSYDDFEVIERAAREDRLPGGSLVAAGGWCAPSETIFDFCDMEVADGLWDLPEFTVKRGGIRTTPGPNLADVTAGIFFQTEAQAIAGTTKPCVEVECPDWDEIRLGAAGICIKVPLLTNAGFPELVRRYLALGMVAHRIAVSNRLLTQGVASAGAAEVFASVGSGASNILDAVALIIERERSKYALGINASMEVALPTWAREVFRADLANRNGVALLDVTDAQINGYFAARKARVQYLRWQPLGATAVAYPQKMQALVYPAGTFTKGRADVISLDAVYDAASLSENTYTGMFFEEGVLLNKRCYDASLLEIPVCVGGRTGAADNTACLTVA